MRLIDTLKPDRVVMLRGGVAPGPDPLGSVGEPGRGPVVAEGDAWLMEQAAAAKIAVQTVPSGRLAVNLGAAHKDLPVHVVATPVLCAQTPVELADARDVESLAQLVGAIAGYGPLAGGRGDATGSPAVSASGSPAIDSPDLLPSTGEAARSFMPAFEAIAGKYGVSGHEAPVREAVLAALPSW